MRHLAVAFAFVASLAVASPARGFDPEQLAADLEARAPAAQVTLTRARRLAHREAWDELRVLLTNAIPALDRGASIDDRLEARALLGRALAHLGQHAEAAARYRRTVALAKGAVLEQRGRDAAGEALFRLAEVEREKADRIVLAPYAGKNLRDAINAYLLGPAARWMKRKQYALEVAERAYARLFGLDLPPPVPPAPPPEAGTGLLSGGDPNAPIAPWGWDSADLEHAPPPASPRWAIAAAARVALAWGAYASALRGLPIAPEWRGPGRVPGAGDVTWEELRSSHVCGFEERSDESLNRRAKHACEAALRLSLQHRIADEHTRACEAWLSKNYGAEWQLVDELRPKIAAPFGAGPFAPARP